MAAATSTGLPLGSVLPDRLGLGQPPSVFLTGIGISESTSTTNARALSTSHIGSGDAFPVQYMCASRLIVSGVQSGKLLSTGLSGSAIFYCANCSFPTQAAS